MFERQILIKRDLDELSRPAADLFTTIAREAIETHENFCVALSGGSTPRHLYSLLAAEYSSAFDSTRVSFFFNDERNVPADSTESNYRMANETLLGPLGIDPDRVHRWHTELAGVDEVAAEYENELKRHFKQTGRRFDLVLLGLGNDAHTASLFPRTAALHENERLAVANWVEKLDEYRLTITFPVINSAANVIFLVSGKEKAEAVARVLEGERRPEEFPAQFVNPENGTLYFLLDEAAASLLNRNQF